MYLRETLNQLCSYQQHYQWRAKHLSSIPYNICCVCENILKIMFDRFVREEKYTLKVLNMCVWTIKQQLLDRHIQQDQQIQTSFPFITYIIYLQFKTLIKQWIKCLLLHVRLLL